MGILSTSHVRVIVIIRRTILKLWYINVLILLCLERINLSEQRQNHEKEKEE